MGIYKKIRGLGIDIKVEDQGVAAEILANNIGNWIASHDVLLEEFTRTCKV